MEALRERLLTIRSTRVYTQYGPEDLLKLYDDLQICLKANDSKLDEVSYLSLMEMLFNVEVYLSKDIEAEVVYNTLRDEFGENSPFLYVMKATLLQINESDEKSKEFIIKLIASELEYNTDSLSYLLLQKKLLSMELTTSSQEIVLDKSLKLVEKFPLDAELWWFIGNLYFKLGQFDQAKHCYEEVVLLQPFNYVAFVRISEILYYKVIRLNKKISKSERTQILQESLNNALRSIELNEMFLKGWSLIAIVSKAMGTKKDILEVSKNKLNEIAKSNELSVQDVKTAELILKNC
ncbi:hypothetical protein Kpol_520p6 [Vanderwaltozyma polyspora DSM 70294]|uniref:ER membrane protein complex subunit 2 n=1 Tax=Vanderwaltozyma polyspora (strain ATCC 22028 / DSM 70294 / BCRC 21397 / CBS 2163 / NBRC 10782 / NRRL Y-8283 / UCD 57-17) TaxID=436907 RepID=A7TM91_VANPO|nr:uncharacterized protein Kpol_520p6 [Vanderwaltozyma polyspora DSM 70294]EDO16585.1 hypothetical protein Kpol_520p6 [Vanderwaltozyma polyspora DSM 70294]